MQSKMKICNTDFFPSQENSSKSVLIFFSNFGSKRDSPQQINCENFVVGCTVGFRAILDQRQAFTTLDES